MAKRKQRLLWILVIATWFPLRLHLTLADGWVRVQRLGRANHVPSKLPVKDRFLDGSTPSLDEVR